MEEKNLKELLDNISTVPSHLRVLSYFTDLPDLLRKQKIFNISWKMTKLESVKNEALRLSFNERVELVETLLDDASLTEEQKNVLERSNMWILKNL